MAGTIPGFSLALQQDSDGTPLAGGKLYTIQAGTVSTPQIAYQDSALTLPLSYPVLCDAYGRLPQIFLADGSIKLRLTKSNGVQVFALDGVLVVGASSGGGGGSPVDATTVLSTGDMKLVYNTGILSGFVRANGRTLGNASSGATERANADTSALFVLLYNADATLSVSGGRGVSAAADYAANKTIALPDLRGRGIAGLDDMGNSAAGRRTVPYTGVVATLLGVTAGSESKTLLMSNLPAYTPSGAIAAATTLVWQPVQSGTGIGAYVPSGSGSGSLNTGVVTTAAFTGAPQGGTSAAFGTVDPTMFLTIYIKL